MYCPRELPQWDYMVLSDKCCFPEMNYQKQKTYQTQNKNLTFLPLFFSHSYFSSDASSYLSWVSSLLSSLSSCWWTPSMKAVSWVRGSSGRPPAPPGPSQSSWPVIMSFCLPGCCSSARHADRTRPLPNFSQVNIPHCSWVNYTVCQSRSHSLSEEVNNKNTWGIFKINISLSK